MLNSVMVVGRLVAEPISQEIRNATKTYMTLEVLRSFKNADGIYDTDFIDVILWEGISNNVKEYCHKGDLVGIRGRLQTSVEEDEEGNKTKHTDIIAEKVTFLSSIKKY